MTAFGVFEDESDRRLLKFSNWKSPDMATSFPLSFSSGEMDPPKNDFHWPDVAFPFAQDRVGPDTY
jgi:hypothetical protein